MVRRYFTMPMNMPQGDSGSMAMEMPNAGLYGMGLRDLFQQMSIPHYGLARHRRCLCLTLWSEVICHTNAPDYVELERSPVKGSDSSCTYWQCQSITSESRVHRTHGFFRRKVLARPLLDAKGPSMLGEHKEPSSPSSEDKGNRACPRCRIW